MERVKWGRLLGVMGVIGLVMAALPFLKGGLIVAKHEADILHLADIVLRMAEFGQIPHLDFMTPLGVLSVAPIAWFVEAGFNFGHAIFMAQALVAIIVFLPAAYAAGTRLPMPWAAVFGGYIMVLVLALVHGEVQSAISISMHYNRWAWAFAYIVVLLVILPARGGGRPLIDGGLIGLAMGVLVLLKATYFVALAPAILIALIARRNWAGLGAALIGGLIVFVLATVVWGVPFWTAYVGDLLAVAGSATRSAPGEDFADVASAPAFLAGNLALIAGVVLLRRAGRMTEGLILLVLAPGFIYITYQNFGNDPQWLLMLAIVMFGARPAGEYREAMGIVGAAALAIGAGSAINMAASPVRHYFVAAEVPTPLIPSNPRLTDVVASKARMNLVSQSLVLDGPDSPFASVSYTSPDTKPAVINGEALPDCGLSSGFTAWFDVVSRDLEQAGYRGTAVLAADLLGVFWLYGDLQPVEGGAPWFYAGASGIENSDYVLVPLCPVGQVQREAILSGIDAAGWGLEEVRRTPLYLLFRPVAPS
jgi:hypothetical protein